MYMRKKKVKAILKASYLNQDDANNKLRNLGYKYDSQLSTNDNKVFIDKNGNPNIAFRGTHKLRTKDLLSDLAVLTGLDKYDTRFKEAQHVSKLVEEKYKKPVNVFGDSLGGALAEKSGATGKIYTHNKATGIGDLFKDIPDNQRDYRKTNDVVSVLSLTQNHKNNNLRQETTNNGVFDVLGNHKI